MKSAATTNAIAQRVVPSFDKDSFQILGIGSKNTNSHHTHAHQKSPLNARNIFKQRKVSKSYFR